MKQSFQCKCGADINPQDDKCFECGYPVGASRLNSEGATYGKTRFR